MSYLQITVSQTNVTYDDWFIYTLDVHLSERDTMSHSGILKITLPDFLEYIPESTTIPTYEIQHTPIDGGILITLDFGSLNHMALATRFDIHCRYKLTTLPPNSFTLNADLFTTSTNIPYLTASAPAVHLIINPLYTLTLTPVIPYAATGASGGSTIYHVLLENKGDQGISLPSFIMTFDLNTTLYLALDTSFPIIGRDISPERYQDLSNDGVTSIPLSTGNGFIFTLPTYKGQQYEFYFKAFISAAASIGNVISLTIPWSIAGHSMPPATATFKVSSPSYTATQLINGPLQVQPGQYMRYTHTLVSTGNQILTNAAIKWMLSSTQINSFRLKTGIYTLSSNHSPLVNTYLITYSSSENPQEEYPLTNLEHEDGLYHTGISSTIDLTTLASPPHTLEAIYFHFNSIPIGMTTLIPATLEAYASDEINLGSVITFPSTLSFELGNASLTQLTTEFITPVSLLSELAIPLHEISPIAPLVPSNKLTFTSTIDCQYSQLNQPIYYTFLPETLELITPFLDLISAFYFEYYNPLSDTIINSIDAPSDFPFPLIEQLPVDTPSPGIFFRLSYSGSKAYSFLQGSWLKISFKARVKEGSIGIYEHYALLGTADIYSSVSQAATAIMSTSHITTKENLFLSVPLAKSPISSIFIHDYPSILASIEAKGADSQTYIHWPDVANSCLGGPVHYKLSIINIGHLPITHLEFVGTLPHIHDTYVLTEQNRGSGFAISRITNIDVSLVDRNGQVTHTSPHADLYYSNDVNPIHFSFDNPVMEDDEYWLPFSTSTSTSITAYRGIIDEPQLLPGEQLIIILSCLLPLDATLSEIAWHSYSVKAASFNSLEHTLLPLEPPKVGVTLLDHSHYASILGITFSDTNKNGLYDGVAEGLNDIGVMLYKIEDDLAYLHRVTLTAPSGTGENGHFSFYFIESGFYMLRFVLDWSTYTFSSSTLQALPSSLSLSSNGFTSIITVNANTIISPILVGFTPLSKNIDFISQVSKQAQHTLRNTIYSQMMLAMKLEDTLSLAHLK